MHYFVLYTFGTNFTVEREGKYVNLVRGERKEEERGVTKG